MKRIVPSLSALVVLSALLAVGAASKDEKVEQEIMKLEKQWIEASVKGDVATLDRIQAEDYLIIDPTGSISTKEQDMKNVKSGELKFESIKTLESKVRVYGDAAVITGKARIKGKFQTQDISGDYSFTDVFVKRKGKWQAVSTQLTRILQ